MRKARPANLDSELLEDIEPVVQVLERAYPKVTREQCYRWLLGDHAVAEDDRVLLDHARRVSKLRIRAEQVRKDIREGRYDAPEPISWRAAA